MKLGLKNSPTVAIQYLLLKTILFLSAINSNAQGIWEPVNIPDSLTVIDINAEKEGVLLMSAKSENDFEGLFRSYDDGQSWQFLEVDSLYHQSYISEISYSPDGRLFLSGSFGIYISDDDGDHCMFVCPTMGSFSRMNFSPSGDAYGVGWGGIIRSTNGGTKWDTLYDPVNSQFFSDIDFGLNNEIYAVGGDFGTGNGFYRSFDDGLTWEATGFPDNFLQSIRVNSQGVIIAGGFDSYGLYQSTDQGNTWTYCASIVADIMRSYNNDNLIAGRNINGYAGCWYSADWGLSWTDLTTDDFNPSVDEISVTPSGIAYINADTTGSYQYKLYRSINPLVGVSEMPLKDDIILYPNPVKDQLNIAGDLVKRSSKIAIYDLYGQNVLNRQFLQNPILLPSLLPGVYFVEIQTPLGIYREKIIHY
jgi:photosystem II stability/assembly factor-like uncharacterized protein